MKIGKLSEMQGGWFIGNFEPSIIKSLDFEVCVKNYNAGETEPTHHQKIATEVTLIISGKVRLGESTFGPGDIILIEPLESFDFEAITDVTLVAVKAPSLPSDKVLG